MAPSPPNLYCICGKTLLLGATAEIQPGTYSCTSCNLSRCESCLWEHLREKHPSVFLNLRNFKQLGRLGPGFVVYSE